jgi:hypothetical protein
MELDQDITPNPRIAITKVSFKVAKTACCTAEFR